MKNRFFSLATLLAIVCVGIVGCTSPNDAGVLPKNGAVVPLLSDAQKAYLKMPRKERIAYFADQKKRDEMKSAGYYPLTVKLQWDKELKGSFIVSVSENRSMFDPCFTIVTDKHSAEIGNLKIATNYYWTVKTENPFDFEPVYTFTTEDFAPRLIRIDGVPNVRDLGGRIGLDGRRVKQGLIYRSAGLNDNAYSRFVPEAELLKQPPIKLEYDLRKANIAAVEAELKAKKIVKYVPYSLSNVWTVFRPAQDKVKPEAYSEFGSLKSIPAEFYGAKAEKIAANKDNAIVFPGTTPYRPSFFIQEFESPEDGVMQIGCGADWFFAVCVNGELHYGAMRHGSIGYPISTDNTILDIPVKKGKNIIAIPLLSGSASWTFACGKPAKALSHDEVLLKRIAAEKTMLKSLLRVANGKEPGKNRLTPKTVVYVTQKLGWKSDIDLRSDGECFGMDGSPAGNSVKWYHYSSAAYGGMADKSGKEAFSRVFKVFLDEKNYPIDFHCIAGQDRTGAVAFILNGLLGVSEEELYLDWETTGFWNGKAHFNHKLRFDKLVAVFEKLPGKNINEKIEYYVLSLGFTKEQIHWFREFMLEKK